MTGKNDFPIGIGDLSRQSGCGIETIRYYEKQRLMPEPPRSAGGHRLYDAAMKKRLVFIRRSRELGFSMHEIREMLSLVDQRAISCQSVKSIADAHLRDIAAKISDLKKMQQTLGELADRCSGRNVSACPILDALQGDGG